jgi:hypothetical protein
MIPNPNPPPPQMMNNQIPVQYQQPLANSDQPVNNTSAIPNPVMINTNTILSPRENVMHNGQAMISNITTPAPPNQTSASIPAPPQIEPPAPLENTVSATLSSNNNLNQTNGQSHTNIIQHAISNTNINTNTSASVSKSGSNSMSPELGERL